LRENPEFPAFFANFTLPASLYPASLIGVNATNSAPKSQNPFSPAVSPTRTKTEHRGSAQGIPRLASLLPYFAKIGVKIIPATLISVIKIHTTQA
jgi:hypothetical protein